VNDPGALTLRCPYCGFRGAAVHVHGHGQCARCRTNIEPCCAGADAASEAVASDGVETGPDPRLFADLFAHLGGVQATVTADALLFALTQRLGTDLDEARIVLEAAERLGQVVPVGGVGYRLRSA
jgi:hypothetical protein